MLIQILLILNILIFLGYNIYIISNFGIPESLSITTYLMGKYYWVFPLICGFFTFTVLPIWLVHYPTTWECLKFLSCSGILFVGTTPFFKRQVDSIIHYTAAILSSVSFVLWMIISGFYWWVGIGLILFIIALMINKKNAVYYGEIIMWFMLLIFLIIL